MKKISTWVIIIYTLTFVFVVARIIRADTTDQLPRQRAYRGESISICNWPELASIQPETLMERFPYSKYLDSCNSQNIVSIRHDLSCLDGLFKDSSMNRQTLSIALTQKLGERHKAAFSGFEADSLLPLIQWAEKFKAYAEIDPDNDIFYESIYNYWMQEVSNTLSDYTVKNSSAKFDFNFKYLWTRCSEQQFSPRTYTPSSEKAFVNIIYNKWGHFINASWNQTSLLQKIAVCLCLYFTVFGFIQTIAFTIKYTKKYIKHE